MQGNQIQVTGAPVGPPQARRWQRAGRFALVLDLMLVALIAGSVPVAGVGRPAGRAAADPIPLLGTTLDADDCVQAPLRVGDGMAVFCPDFSAITSPRGRVLVVSVYGPDHGVVAEFQGLLPQGLAWRDTIAEVWERLGRPQRITGAYGTPTLVYMFDDQPYGSLELRFDVDDRLDRINACLTH